MPELPEVETVVRSLRPLVEGKKLGKARLLFPAIVRSGQKGFARRLEGVRIGQILRRGKYILCRLSSGDCLIFHLGMTGRLFLERTERATAKHTHLKLAMEGDPLEIRFEDPRRFGRILLLTSDEADRYPALRALGPEPSEVTLQQFRQALLRHKRPIKALLLDQHCIAGMGNIYSDEALFHSRIHPRQIAATLSGPQASRLYRSIRKILEKAIQAGGSSIRDYVDGLGRQGRFQLQYYAYGRSGQDCRRRGCRGNIVRIQVGGRSTHFCPVCQPLP